jgi:beta-1,4-mannosyl-glycoprotein beta-1,4-N-acetylglucosaminyltransferase
MGKEQKILGEFFMNNSNLTRSLPPPIVYDCFQFFNELDLLEIRLNILSGVVDKFVLVEADKSHSNQPKPLYFEENKSHFQSFLDKIIHIKITQYPDIALKNAWAAESYQRNMILEGLKNCNPDDVVIISDVDEIPTIDIINQFKEGKLKGIHNLSQMRCNYYINYRAIIRHWLGTNMLNYKDIIENNAEKYKYVYDEVLVESLNQGTTPTKIRMLQDAPIIKNAGWHFSFLGGLDNIIYKLTSFTHHTDYEREYADKNLLIERIDKGIDLFQPKNTRFVPIKIDKRFPKYIVENQDKYAHLIYRDISLWHNITIVVYMYLYYYLINLPASWFKKTFKHTSLYKKAKGLIKRT